MLVDPNPIGIAINLLIKNQPYILGTQPKQIHKKVCTKMTSAHQLRHVKVLKFVLAILCIS